MEKKKYISPDVELIDLNYLCYHEGFNDNATIHSGNDGVDANSGFFDEEEDNNGFTPVATSLWD